MLSVIVNYNTSSLNERSALVTPEIRPMKTPIYNRFGGGLIVLVMLTIAVVAGQSEPNFDQPGRTEDAFELDGGLQVTIDNEGPAELEALSSVVEEVLDLPIRIEASIEASESPLPDIADSNNTPVQ